MADTSAWKPVAEDTSAWKPVEQPSAVSRFISSVGQALNPVPMVKDWWANLGNQSKSVNTLGKILELREKGLKDDDPQMKALLDEAMGIKLPTSGDQRVTQVPFMSEPAIAAGRQAAEGDVAGALGTVTGAYGVPAAIGAAVPYVKPAAKAVARAATTPGVAQMVGGAGEAVAGAAMTPTHPIAGPSLVVGAAARIKKGFEAFRAGREVQAAADQVARGQQLAAEHRAGPQPTPAWQSIPDAQPPAAAAPVPVEEPQLPSGRVPGGIANQRRSWQELVQEAGGGPAPVETPAPKLTPAQINKLPAREAVKYLQAQRGNVQSIAEQPGFRPAVEMPQAGAVEVGANPPAQPSANPKVSAPEPTPINGANPPAFEARARAENAASFSKLLHEAGITADLAASMDPEQWAQVKTQAKISEAKAAGQRITPEMLKQKAPSAETIKAALDELKKLEATAPPDDLASLLRQSVEQARSRKVNK